MSKELIKAALDAMATLGDRLAQGWGEWKFDGCRVVHRDGAQFCWMRSRRIAHTGHELSAHDVATFGDAMSDISTAVLLGMVDTACSCEVDDA